MADENSPDHLPELSLIEGRVPKAREHLTLQIRKNGETVELARIAPRDPGQQENGPFLLEWLIGNNTADHRQLRREVTATIDFYLIELAEPNPWRYLIHHSTSTSNFYSGDKGGVHWKWIQSEKSPHQGHPDK